MATGNVSIKRIYEPAAESDGFRVLVDRLWPRGISKVNAQVDLWLRDIAPSASLRRWFDHDPVRWKPFCMRYRAELRKKSRLLASLKERARKRPVTLLYAAREERFNHAVALRAVLKKGLTRPASRRRTRSSSCNPLRDDAVTVLRGSRYDRRE